MDISALLEPVVYTMSGGGKNIRGLVVKYVQGLLHNQNNPVTELIISDVDVAHNASLVIDDIQDDSETRRGKPCAHLIYGTPLSINSAYLKCFNLLAQIGTKYPEEIAESIRRICIQLLEKAHVGQGLDISWTNSGYIPSMTEYLYMIDNKTGAGFWGGSELCFITLKPGSATTKERKDKIRNLMVMLGRFYQIRDDYINLTCPKYWRAKGFCGDLDEKKVSYIFTLLKQQDPHDSLYKKLCSKSDLSDADKIEVYCYLHKKTILHQTYTVLNAYVTDICEAEQELTQKLGRSEFMQHLFSKLDYPAPMAPEQIKSVLAISTHLAFSS